MSKDGTKPPTPAEVFRAAGYSGRAARRWAARCQRFGLDPGEVLERIANRVIGDRMTRSEAPLEPHYQDW